MRDSVWLTVGIDRQTPTWSVLVCNPPQRSVGGFCNLARGRAILGVKVGHPGRPWQKSA